MRDPDLADLDAFRAVAESRSFRRAAALRNVSASSLSAALQRLEAQLGLRLLNRTTRSVTPTEAGQRLLDRLRPALGEIGAALDAINDFRATPTGTLRLDVPHIVARHVLPGIAIPFLKAHPGITLEIRANDTFIDVLAAGFDAGIRYDESLERDMIRLPIGPRRQRFVLAASPGYLARAGTPRHPDDLLRHACIRHRFASGNILQWEFEKGHKTVKLKVAGPLIASTADLAVNVAIGGLGFVYTFEEYLAPALKAGSLTGVLPDWWAEFSGPYLYYPSRNLMPAPLRAFVDFVKALAAGSNAATDL
ncbi:LysR family transcriptional regulator [Dongia sp.]|jgi:DNA-binding transcriptional LysR family regulator|uniref:LysR family transcriptional regulator n=1 Tax=Dongia sp. TaxID=1977262 RepID=UPI0035AFA479